MPRVTERVRGGVGRDQALPPRLSSYKGPACHRACGPVAGGLDLARGLWTGACWPLSPRDRRWSWVGGQPARLSAASTPGAREMGRLHPLSAQTGNRGSGDGMVWPGGSHAGARSALPSVLSRSNPTLRARSCPPASASRVLRAA